MTKVEAEAVAAAEQPGGLWSWITTVDHKRIGMLYGVTALFFLVVGGIQALLLRIQLSVPEASFLHPDTYNQVFTMHGTIMVFLVAMPLAVALFNFVVPLQIGARDVAFPRLNALSYWIFLFGGIFLCISIPLKLAPNAAWVGYAPLTIREFSPGMNVDFWVLGLTVLGIASILGGVNFITTIINLRAPGMGLMRMPLFTWMALVTSFLLITAMPVIGIALIFLTFDRFFGSGFFVTTLGGDPVLWQHLFWLFGHPEVYILILPAFGAISDIIPTFSRKPLFGYAIMVFSGILIGFIGWGVWGHHMFTTGLGPLADAFFAVSTMIIAIPTGVKIFNWLATMWGGAIRFATPMLFCIALIPLFTIGGISGIMHAVAPHNLQQHDTYFVVAHFHYVLIGGMLFGLFGAIYYWYPKLTGRLLSESLGKWHFWLFLIGFNLTFFPMHFMGLLGMPRRIFTYPAELGLGTMNVVATVGAFIQGVAILIFLWNLYRSVNRGALAGPNPWKASTLEWSMDSPPPVYNFAKLPQVNSREPLWDRDGADPQQQVTVPASEIELPSPSFWPIVVAFGITLAAVLLLLTGAWWSPLIGAAVVAVGIVNWAFEPEFR